MLFVKNEFTELKASLPKDQDIVNVKTEHSLTQPKVIKTEEAKKDEKIELKTEEVKVKQENENIKTENVEQNEIIKTENEDEQNVKIDVVTCSPGYFFFLYYIICYL